LGLVVETRGERDIGAVVVLVVFVRANESFGPIFRQHSSSFPSLGFSAQRTADGPRVLLTMQCFYLLLGVGRAIQCE